MIINSGLNIIDSHVGLVKMMECNLDARGKAVRLFGGLFSLLVGIIIGVLFGSEILIDSIWYSSSIILILAGTFGIFEGRTGWCVVRAMGFKTPI